MLASKNISIYLTKFCIISEISIVLTMNFYNKSSFFFIHYIREVNLYLKHLVNK